MSAYVIIRGEYVMTLPDMDAAEDEATRLAKENGDTYTVILVPGDETPMGLTYRYGVLVSTMEEGSE